MPVYPGAIQGKLSPYETLSFFANKTRIYRIATLKTRWAIVLRGGQAYLASPAGN
jgi:hypothetical protein